MTKRKDAHPDYCDMLVIGSLMGGSVAAVELTEMGDSLRISAVWRKRPNKGAAGTTWNIKRFAWPPRGRKGIQRIYLLAEALAHAGVGIGSRVLQRIRSSRPSTNTTATIYSIAERARRS